MDDRMKRLNLTCIALLFSVVVLGQHMEKKSTEIPNGWKPFKGENFWMIYPEDWELNESGQMGTTFVILSPLSSEQDQFRENVNLLVQDLKGYNISLAQFATVSEEQVRSIVPEGKLIRSERISGNTLDFHKMTYTGKQGTFDMIFEQYFWVENEKAYILSFSSEQLQYDVYKAVGMRMLNSFQLFAH